MLLFGIKGELLEVIEGNLDSGNAEKLKERLNACRTKKERDEIVYWVERDEG